MDATLKEMNSEKIEDAHRDTPVECRVVAREEQETHAEELVQNSGWGPLQIEALEQI